MNHSHADKIWNRAAMDEGGDKPLEGDIALAAMLLAHGLIMNGGVHHAVECLDADELDCAMKGYSFFEFAETVGLLSSISEGAELSEWNEENELTANKTYNRLIPDDETIGKRFEEKFRVHPEVFNSISG
jgi:hypothetical protein